ncbi:hypothetical protein D9758_017617 [Tetrapyrgos nigripes]|uniref:Uncharacterized protein n=1 Tax=Tetrapyrgos nigripes TaxID=182062 RepID=A0A8H5BXQ0_9AGAR|nr:hypothetical protein D9758_017617 [Tetrapyrgos nigripes]
MYYHAYPYHPYSPPSRTFSTSFPADGCFQYRAFGLVVSIALLAKIPSWADVWSRYWLRASEEWGSAKEKGLSAGFCLFLLAGVGIDWLLSRFVGECPDEKWDTYLANYTSNLPNRAGTFKPFESFWDRWFRSTSENDKENILFPEDTDKPKRPGFPGSRSSVSFKPWSSPRPLGAFSATSTIVGDDHGTDFDKLKPKDGERSSDILDDVPSLGYPYSSPRSPRAPPAFLSKSGPQKAKAKAKSSKKSKKSGKREAVKFGGDYTSSEEDEDDNVPLGRPTFHQSSSMASMTTLVAPPSPGLGKALSKKTSMGFHPRPRDDANLKEEMGEIDYEEEVEKLRGYKKRSEAGSVPRSSSREGREAPEYSDYESDREKHRKDNMDEKDSQSGPWTPGFLKAPRRQSASGTSGASGASGSGSGSQASGSTLVGSSPRLGLGTGVGTVPATPSLIRALDRVALAQKDAYPYPASPTAQGLARVEEAQEQPKGQGSPVPLSLPRVEEEGKEQTKEQTKDPRRNDRWENFWRDVRDKAEAEGS